MEKITAIILTKNEEENIKDCIKSLQFTDEIIVIDDNSIDQTTEIAGKLGCKVYTRNLNKDYAAQRNFGLSKAKNQWVLFIDADEVVSSDLADEISSSISKSNFKSFFIKRQDYFIGRKLRFGETANLKLLRLGKRGSGKWSRPVHEVWDIKGETKELKEKLIHHPHPTISEFIDGINQYTDIESQYRNGKGQKASIWQTIFFPIGKFIKNYIFLFGFLDGFQGFIMAFMMSLHSLTVRIKLRSLCI